MARSTARKRALNTLYEADEKGQDILSLLAERLQTPGAQTPLPDYAVDIVKGVAQHVRHIDSVLDEHSETWTVSRMPVVDRNILRIGTWEIVYNDEIPPRVAIDEALQLTKKLSDYDAPAFVHGVLSAISDDPDVAPEPEVTPEDEPETSAENSSQTEGAVSEDTESQDTESDNTVSEESTDSEDGDSPNSETSVATGSEDADSAESAPEDPDSDPQEDVDFSDIKIADFAVPNDAPEKK
ncbi:MAG: transcription antitermination factor NusB [Bifidobacteriaceae bacterium]|jgi:N utilization substance protein B|nr:transcription antitermination factor NusB [Bifidobacteriaceae bacterium]